MKKTILSLTVAVAAALSVAQTKSPGEVAWHKVEITSHITTPAFIKLEVSLETGPNQTYREIEVEINDVDYKFTNDQAKFSGYPASSIVLVCRKKETGAGYWAGFRLSKPGADNSIETITCLVDETGKRSVETSRQ